MEPTAPKDDFYIGWRDELPAANQRPVKQFVIVALIISLLLAILLVIGQRGFASSIFELGQLTDLTGVYTATPVPMLQIEQNEKQQSILLVGFGKHGAEATIAAMEEEQGTLLEGKQVTFKGTLIYYQDRTVMELTKGAASLVALQEGTSSIASQVEDYGFRTLRGEILDPKCALGVMKPGYGKPHRSCAVRCIAGGIPPILRMTALDGATNYCLVKGPEGEKINTELLPYVADQLRLCGRLERIDDWLVFYLDPQDILRLQPHWMEGEIPLCNQLL